ncbi:MAG: S8 family serine peptidase [Vallitalea sp.]|nr:S8 family serine peptidase [Vallitalea sp.]
MLITYNTERTTTLLELVNYSQVYEMNNEGFYGEDINIVVIDTGVALHEDLKGNIILFKDFVNDKRETYDDNGHGTNICGIIAGYGVKYRGIAPRSKIIMLKGIDKDGLTNMLYLSRCFQWIIENKQKYNIEFVCMSLGFDNNDDNIILDNLIDSLYQNKIQLITSAGNRGMLDNRITSPGNYVQVLTVGSINYIPSVNQKICDSKISEFSSMNSENNKPDLFAPGERIFTTSKYKDYYEKVDGTSYSAAIVTGQLVLLREKYKSLMFDEFNKVMKTFVYNKILY